MTHAQSMAHAQSTIPAPSTPYAQAIDRAQSHLLAARDALQSEISGYPAPIAGCDAQFNHLLAERQRVLLALRALEEAVFVPTPRSPTADAGIESR